MKTALRPMLRSLADRAGILREYVDVHGGRCEASEITCEALLAAMGFDASNERSAHEAMERLDAERGGRVLEPTRVVTQSSGPVAVGVRLPESLGDNVEYEVECRLEQGSVDRRTGRLPAGVSGNAVSIVLNETAPPGYHEVSLRLRGGGGREKAARQRLIVAPSSCCSPQEKFGRRDLFGVWTQLYSLRGPGDCGVGDFAALGELVEWAGDMGASFVGLNPLHALRNRGADVSPYSPVSRLYRNVLYLDLSAIPELATCVEAKAAMGDFPASLRESGFVQYDEVLSRKLTVLRELHREFVRLHGSGSTPRGREYRAFVEREGDGLRDYATFVTLDEHFRRDDPRRGWRDWPAGLRDPRSADVAEFRRRQQADVDFQCYLQFEIDRQLEASARRTRELGMPVGLYQDLALGTSPDGCEPWAYPDLFVRGVSLGAPPDELGPAGQNWDLPPLHPLRLRETGYEYWRTLLGRSFASAGALRIDHVMGLLRQYWIPEGKGGADGAYVSFPADDLFAILALESRRANAVVIGEDLGTVPPGFEELLARWGVLSTRVLYFERDEDGEFRGPDAFPARSLSTISTHDLAPLAGFWRDRDLTLRRKVGQLRNDAELAAAAQRRESDRQALVRRFRSENIVDLGENLSDPDVVAAAHAILARSPAALVGVSVDDLALEREPVNLPGIGQDQHPNWSRRVAATVSELRASQSVARMLAPLAERRFEAVANVQEPP